MQEFDSNHFILLHYYTSITVHKRRNEYHTTSVTYNINKVRIKYPRSRATYDITNKEQLSRPIHAPPSADLFSLWHIFLVVPGICPHTNLDQPVDFDAVLLRNVAPMPLIDPSSVVNIMIETGNEATHLCTTTSWASSSS